MNVSKESLYLFPKPEQMKEMQIVVRMSKNEAQSFLRLLETPAGVQLRDDENTEVAKQIWSKLCDLLKENM